MTEIYAVKGLESEGKWGGSQMLQNVYYACISGIVESLWSYIRIVAGAENTLIFK